MNIKLLALLYSKADITYINSYKANLREVQPNLISFDIMNKGGVCGTVLIDNADLGKAKVAYNSIVCNSACLNTRKESEIIIRFVRLAEFPLSIKWVLESFEDSENNRPIFLGGDYR